MSNPAFDGSSPSDIRSIANALLSGFAHALARHSFFLAPSARPTLLLEWLAIAMAVASWRCGRALLGLQVAVLIITAWGLDAIFWLRGLKTAYFAYTDPLLIVAAALTGTELERRASAITLRKAALGLAVLYVVWGHLEPLKLSFSAKDPGEDCQWLHGYLSRVESFPFCQP